MIVQEFVKQYSAISNKSDFVKKHIKTNYVSFATKLGECLEIIKRTSYKQIEGTDTEIFKVNSPLRYNLFIQRIIVNYTDIEFIPEKWLETYDLLNEVGAIETIIAAIPQKEYREFSTLLKMCGDDEVANTQNIVSFFDDKFKAVELVVNKTFETLASNPELQDKIIQFKKDNEIS